MTKHKMISLSFLQGIPQMSFPQSFLGNCLASHGYELLTLHCHGELEYLCPTTTALNMDHSDGETKKKSCLWCRNYAKKNQRNVKGFHSSILSLLDREKINSICKEIDELSQEQLAHYHYECLPAGRFSAYIPMIRTQSESHEELLQKDAKLWKNSLKTQMLFFHGYLQHCKQFQPTHCLLSDNCYGFHRIVKEWNSLHNIKTVCLSSTPHHESRYEHFAISHTDPPNDYIRHSRLWCSNPTNPRSLQKVLSYLENLYRKFDDRVYSLKTCESAYTILQKFQIPKNASVTLLATSSWDEVSALDYSVYNQNLIPEGTKIFPSQTLWILHTIELFKKYPNAHLIIRLHPREYFRGNSANLDFLRSIANTLPKNIHIDFPELKTSVYDLYCVIDLTLTSISSTGLEAGILGVPNVSYTKGLGHIPFEIFHPSISDQSDWSKLVSEKISSPFRDPELSKKAISWLAWVFEDYHFHFSSDHYFEKYPKQDKHAQYLHQKRKRLNLPALRIEDFLASTQISDQELSVFLEAIESEKAIHEIKAKNHSQQKIDWNGFYQEFYDRIIPDFQKDGKIKAFFDRILSNLS